MREDLTGRCFGRLIVVRLSKIDKWGASHWWCQCECGEVKSIAGKSLKGGTTKSCGCLRKATTSKRAGKDLTGQKRGRLTIVKLLGVEDKQRVWECHCECGAIVFLTTSRLWKTKSCGCLSRDTTSQMMKADLVGEKRGRLTIVKSLGVNKHGKQEWLCLCECGNQHIADTGALNSGNTKSCGCYMRDRFAETKRLRLEGRRFGRLTVLEFVGIDDRNHTVWKCRCECGNEIPVVGTQLTGGITRSCGCLQKDVIADMNVARVEQDVDWDDVEEADFSHLVDQVKENPPPSPQDEAYKTFLKDN